MNRTLADGLWVGGAVAALLVAALVTRDARHRETPPSAAAYRDVKNGPELAVGAHRLGSSAALVTVVEFSDLECPFCRSLQETLGQVQARHPGALAIAYRHYPLAIHPHAYAAAIASECAAAQHRFQAFIDEAFARQDSLGRVEWELLALAAGVPDTSAFGRCRRSNEMRQRVEADIAAGQALKIIGTPAIVIRNRLYLGAPSLDTLEAWLGLDGASSPSAARTGAM